MKKLRALFFGTPQLSADILTYLIKDGSCDIVGVVSNPDTTGGRGHTVIQSPVTLIAHQHDIPLLQPEKIRTNPEFLEMIKNLKPDICLVVAYGKILPQVLLDIPPMGFLNVHTSLLPKYRGAAPIQHALLNGETTTGLTIMQMSLGMDEGDILIQESWEVNEDDTTGILFQKTGERAGPLLIEALKGLQDGSLKPQKQDSAQATYTKMIEKTDGEIRFDWTLDHAYHAWQAYTPWPGLSTFFGETKVTLHKVSKSDKIQREVFRGQTVGAGCGTENSWNQSTASFCPLNDFGTFVSKSTERSWCIYKNTLPALTLIDGYLIIHELTPAGKKRMSGEDFVRGYLIK